MLISPEIIKLLGSESYWNAQYCVIPIIGAGYFTFLYTIPSAIEYYYSKTKYIALGTMGAAILNIILNFIFINLFGYIAAAYTTLFTYFIYFIVHYIISKKIFKKDIFNSQIIFLSILILLGMIFFINIFINNMLIRLIILIIVLFFSIFYEEKEFGLMKKYLKKG